METDHFTRVGEVFSQASSKLLDLFQASEQLGRRTLSGAVCKVEN